MSKDNLKNKRNAVLYKEMTVDIKKPKIMLTMLLINIFLSMITLCFFIGISISGVSGALDFRVLAWYLIAMIFVEATMLLFITPALTAGSVSLEKERQTLDVLLTTRMTTWEIVFGKFFSSFLFLSLMVLSTFPLLALVFVYGGISLIQLIYIGISMVVYIGFISCFGIFFSALTKNTVVSVILTYMFLFFYIVFTFAFPFLLESVIAAINSIIYNDTRYFYMITDEHFINGDILMLTGTLNPLMMIYDVLGNTIGYNFGDTSFKGWVSLCGTGILPHFTEKNIIMKLWTPISMIQFTLITFLVLKLSSALLNPIKGRKKQKKQKEKVKTKDR